MRSVDVPALVEQIRAGRPRAVARAISLIDDRHPLVRELMAALARERGSAHLVGLTGSPGVGKSTTTNALIARLRAQHRTVGVLAVDPSSPFSGGALLGDRIRMEEHSADSSVYLRSMASRGHLGGLTAAAPQAVRVLEAAGCDIVLIETVGVGQSEVEIAALADTTVVLLAPGMGDGVQAAKAGILEVGDVFVVNKADRDGAEQTVREVRHMIQLGNREQEVGWRTPVLRTIASRGDGIPEVVDSLAAHHDWLRESGELTRARRSRARAEIEAIAFEQLRARMRSGAGGLVSEDLAAGVAHGDTDAYAAADHVLAALTAEGSAS